MALLHQYDAHGFYIGPVDEPGKYMPHGCDLAPPPGNPPDGHSYRRVGQGRFRLVEDHRGREGYLNGEPHVISNGGPLPEGWSDTPPLAEAVAVKRAEMAETFERALWAELLLDPEYGGSSSIMVELALFAAQDPEGLEWLKEQLEEQRSRLEKALENARSQAELDAIRIAPSLK